MFESSVIFNGYETGMKRTDDEPKFESSVIFNGYET